MVGAAVRGRGREGRDLLPIAGRVVDADATGRIGTADIPAGVKRRPAVKNRILYLKQRKSEPLMLFPNISSEPVR